MSLAIAANAIASDAPSKDQKAEHVTKASPPVSRVRIENAVERQK